MTKEHIDEFEQRTQKMHTLREEGNEPYPSATSRTLTVADFLAGFDEKESGGAEETLAGRVRLHRAHGGVMFLQLQDESGTVQVVLSKKDTDKAVFDFVKNMVDVGDIIDVTGTAFVTKKGEKSLLATAATMLSKALKPLPDKWQGIQDDETRFRKRYLDMVMTPGVREMFVKKSRFWNSMREFLVKEGFLEVETPVLEATPGGADAEAFATHHNALDIDLYLRISMGELWQKRLMVGGFEKTFEIGRQFRNEGISPEHLQDYTQMEFYWGYANYEDTMDLVERMYKHVIMETFGTLEFEIRGFTVNIGDEWKKIDYVEEVEKHIGINVLDASDDELRAKAKELGIEVEDGPGRGRLIDTLWKYCRKSLGGPLLLINHPVEVSPLAKRRVQDPRTTERYQVIIAGSEVGNGYSELNDPVDQAERFAEQAKMREEGDAEAQMHDEDFVEALRYGMPPTSGFGTSERLFSFLMDKPIRECVMFPLLRPKHETLASGSQPVNGDDPTLAELDAGITRDEAKEWMFEHVKDENLRKHMLSTEAFMQALGEHFNAVSPEAWGIAGLLHDIDYENCKVEKHSLVGADMLTERGANTHLVDAVREHNPAHGLEASTLLSKTMMSLEQLTGLVLACVYVRPDKSIHSVKVKSVKKKFKDKSFAAGVNRDNIKKAEELIGITLEEAIEICLGAMQANAKEIGLE